MGSEEANVQRILNIVGIASIVALAATPAAAGHGGFLGGLFGGGRGAPVRRRPSACRSSSPPAPTC